MVTIKEFQNFDLRTAHILEAKPHPDADRLYVLQIQIGEEKRQLVAGIRQHYAPEELVGKTIVVIANLEPAVIRGVESQGMLLAASDGERVVLLAPDKQTNSGCKIR